MIRHTISYGQEIFYIRRLRVNINKKILADVKSMVIETNNLLIHVA